MKYDLINFSLIIIILPNASNELLISLEQYVMNIYNFEYNILKIVGSPAGREFSEKYKLNIRKILGSSI